MTVDQLINPDDLISQLREMAGKTKNKAVHEDLNLICRRINTIYKLEATDAIKNDYFLAVEFYIQAMRIRQRNDGVVRFTHFPKEDMFRVAFRFVYDPTVETNYMAPAVEPMRDYLAINSCAKLPHEVQVGIYHVLAVGCNLNRHYMQTKDGINEKTEATITSYCEAIDRMTASAMALSLRSFF